MARKHTLKLRELRRIRIRFAVLLGLTAFLTAVILGYLVVRTAMPAHTQHIDEYFRPGTLGFFGFAALLLTLAQYGLLRQLTVGDGRRIEEMTYTDDLTGTGNRRHIAKFLAEEFREAQLSRNPLSVVFIDIDDFKQINDEYGHQAGDLVLRAAGHAVRESIREEDMVGRAGGDEFVVVLPDTDSQCASVVARRIAERFQGISVTIEGARPIEGITGSMGISSYPTNANTRKGLIDDADRSMYAAKRSGKGTIVVSIARATGPEPRSPTRHVTAFANEIGEIVDRDGRRGLSTASAAAEERTHV
ncbi:MAG: GGDEF domain-containing protein [Planctomycetota bacterium]